MIEFLKYLLELEIITVFVTLLCHIVVRFIFKSKFPLSAYPLMIIVVLISFTIVYFVFKAIFDYICIL